MSAALFILRLAIVIFVIIGIYRVGQYAYFYGYSIMSDAAVDEEPGRDVSVKLEKGMDAEEVAHLLERKGLVEDENIFRIQLKVNDYEDKLVPGDYVLNTSMAPKVLMRTMAGETVEEEEE